MTYGQIAITLGDGYTPRTVGYVMRNSDADDVPWQRVINSQGKISHQSDSQRQRQLLEGEGLEFVNHKLNLDLYQWGNDDSQSPPVQESLF